MNQLTLELLEGDFGVCRLPAEEPIPSWCQQGEFYSMTKTRDELSIVCLEQYIPSEVQTVEANWRI